MTAYDRLLWAAYFTPMGPHSSGEEDWGARLLLWGPPGGGKTSACSRMARTVGAQFLAIDSTVGEGALGACPTPDFDAAVLRFLPAEFVASFKPDAPGLLLCDDATTFEPALQKYLLGLLLHKRIGFAYLPARCRVWMAANEVKDTPGGWELAPAVANRPCHIDWPDAEVDDWCAFMLAGGLAGAVSNGVDAIAEEQRVLDMWPECWARAVGEMVAFSGARRDLHRVQPPEDSAASHRAWPSPRTKEFATRALASSYAHALDAATTDTYVAGYVGSAFADEWSIWRSALDLPNAMGLLDGTESFEHNPMRLDRTSAVLASCCSLMSNEQLRTKQRTKRLFTVLDSVSDDALDLVAAVMIGGLHQCGLSRAPEARDLLRRLRPLLAATENMK